MVKSYKSDPVKTQELLTRYCNDLANSAVDRYWKLAEELWSRYTNSF
jgi:hypothetical protein